MAVSSIIMNSSGEIIARASARNSTDSISPEDTSTMPFQTPDAPRRWTLKRARRSIGAPGSWARTVAFAGSSSSIVSNSRFSPKSKWARSAEAAAAISAALSGSSGW